MEQRWEITYYLREGFSRRGFFFKQVNVLSDEEQRRNWVISTAVCPVTVCPVIYVYLVAEGCHS